MHPPTRYFVCPFGGRNRDCRQETMDNCYQPDPEIASARLRREFESPAFDEWLERLSDRGLFQILIALMLKMERLVRAPLDGTRRQTVMQRLVAVANDVADDLPRGTGRAGAGQGQGQDQPLSLEQRLICLTFKNLKRTLEVLDRSGGGGISQRDAARRWVLQELFACLGRQIELGALWGRPCPPQTWQELHDLYAYCRARLGSAGERQQSDGGFDPETAYKRLLLMGLIAGQGAKSLLAPERTGRFAAWVDETELNDPGSYFGVLGAFLVECSRDIPPHRVPGALGSVSRAWVLEAPAELVAELSAIRAERERRDFAVE
jgi:hypothetical protein